jgi:hypothetical protein
MKHSKYHTETLPITTQNSLPAKRSLRKPWSRSITRPNWTTQKRDNANLEGRYHQIIAMVKKLHLKQGELYFERDYKDDSTEGYLAMHSFLTSSFYLYIECELTYDYHVEWAFHNCSYEAEVMEILTRYPMDTMSREVTPTPDLPTFYKRTLAIQSREFVYCFKG